MNCDLELWERLCEDVRSHFFCGAVFHVDMPVVNHLANEVKSNIDMFRVSVVIVICSESERGLVVTVESGRSWGRSKKGLDKSSKPDAVLRGVSCCDIFGLSCG